MRQEIILALLYEAASPSCDRLRRTKIQAELQDAISEESDESEEFEHGRVDGIRAVFDTLYVETLKDRPELLPSLFPAFVIMCGDREEQSLICDQINWSLMQ